MQGRTGIFLVISLIVILSFHAAPVSAQGLTIDYRYNMIREDAGNYLTFSTPNRFVFVNKDAYDAGTGASAQKGTSLFASVYLDMSGKTAFPDGLRGVILFPLAPPVTKTEDNFRAAKDKNGVITLEYAHRGVAYKITTDAKGHISLPRGNFLMRTIGYIVGHDPQVISTDFSTDGTAGTIDWNKVWDAKIPSGRAIAPDVATLTGSIQNDYGNFTAMFNWDGELTLGLENNVLTISGKLNIVKR